MNSRKTGNIDPGAEKIRFMEETLMATLNILDDFNEEKLRLEETQRALINILEDFDYEKTANKELEAFSYSVSHDLRAPLRAIDGFSRILMEEYEDKLDEEGRRQFKLIRDNIVRMSQLIDDLLALSRLGRKEIVPSSIDMEELLSSVLDELESLTSGRDVTYTVGKIHPVNADPNMLRQVLINLVSNAIKFTAPRDHAVIEISSVVEGNRIVYCVKDNGVGFNMQYFHKLFGIFQRLHGQEEFQGTGIGLAIVKRIINKHNGEVWAEGELNEGAAFYFSLPNI